MASTRQRCGCAKLFPCFNNGCNDAQQNVQSLGYFYSQTLIDTLPELCPRLDKIFGLPDAVYLGIILSGAFPEQVHLY